MNTPIYREMDRLFNNNMTVCRNTVYNWFVKGSDYLKKVLPVLKDKLLAKGAVVNCDETWCRVKVAAMMVQKYQLFTTRSSRHARCVVCQRLNILKNSSRLRLNEYNSEFIRELSRVSRFD